ncbi:MAG: AAA family ATPase [Acidimicrobiales bacterium]
MSEDNLFLMLGMCADSVTGKPLGRAPNRAMATMQRRISQRIKAIPGNVTVEERVELIARIETEEQARSGGVRPPVAGFDLTFSPSKSISAAWALADPDTKAVIYACHLRAIEIVMEYAEREVFHSRSGTDGVVEEDIDAGRRLASPTANSERLGVLPNRVSIDQAIAVDRIATSGRLLDVLIGPAGTGKSQTMRTLRALWEAEHGPGSVIGLAPSAAAAEVLAEELGIATENTAKWLTEYRRQTDRQAKLDGLRRQLGSCSFTASTEGAVRRHLSAVQADIDRWRLRAGQLVIIDEGRRRHPLPATGPPDAHLARTRLINAFSRMRSPVHSSNWSCPARFLAAGMGTKYDDTRRASTTWSECAPYRRSGNAGPAPYMAR